LFGSLKLLSDHAGRQGEVLRKSSSTRPTLWVAEENETRAVVKDYSTNRFFYRNTIGRFLIWRETRAYRKLRGLKGVPTFYRVIDGLALVIEEISGQSIEGLEKREKLSKEFFVELRALVESVHRRGLAHCDLNRAPNILLGHDGKPYIVDWSASISEQEFKFFPLNLIPKRFFLDDLNAIIKVQLRHSPSSITPEEKMCYDQRSKSEKLIRATRDRLRNLLQRFA
jgi:RIO-like serine/threonine protein kinase